MMIPTKIPTATARSTTAMGLLLCMLYAPTDRTRPTRHSTPTAAPSRQRIHATPPEIRYREAPGPFFLDLSSLQGARLCLWYHVCGAHSLLLTAQAWRKPTRSLALIPRPGGCPSCWAAYFSSLAGGSCFGCYSYPARRPAAWG